MTRHTRTTLLALAIGASLCLAPARAETDPIESMTASVGSSWSYGDRTISYMILEEQLQDSPVWSDPGHEAPPLSIGQAIDISKQELSRYAPEVSAWTLEAVALTRFDRLDRWYYVVTWEVDGLSVDHRLYIPVLMNALPVALSWYEPERESRE